MSFSDWAFCSDRLLGVISRVVFGCVIYPSKWLVWYIETNEVGTVLVPLLSIIALLYLQLYEQPITNTRFNIRKMAVAIKSTVKIH